MKVGDSVIHKNTGEKLTIKKIYGEIATCESEIMRVITEKPYFETNTVICQMANLVSENK